MQLQVKQKFNADKRENTEVILFLTKRNKKNYIFSPGVWTMKAHDGTNRTEPFD